MMLIIILIAIVVFAIVCSVDASNEQERRVGTIKNKDDLLNEELDKGVKIAVLLCCFLNHH